MIETCWGGSPAEVWMSERVLSSNPDYKRDILDPYDAAIKRRRSNQHHGQSCNALAGSQLSFTME